MVVNVRILSFHPLRTMVWLLLVFLVPSGQAQSESATVTSFDGFGELTNVIATEKTKANLSCESGDMVVKLQFADNFRGVIYADRDRQSPCNKYGDGSTFYIFQIPLQGCGTKERVSTDYRMFVNDIVVRFHPTLELEGDEVKTILCRYPPPVAPLPPFIPPLPEEVPAVVAAGPRRLSEVELMLIICAILFLALLLLGIGLAYYCLKKRNIKIVKRRKVPSGPPSQITKLSGSTLGPLSIPFDGIRIPRATAHSVSGSEALLTSAGEHSDTITSDYPSESPSSVHSDVEEVETRVSTSQFTHSAYDNQAYLDERNYIPQPPSPPRMETSTMTRETITTIREEEEYRRRQAMMIMQQQQQQQQQQQREAPPAPPPRFVTEAPVYARIRKRQMEQVRDERSMSETTEEVTHMTYPPPPPSTETDPSFPPDRRTVSEFSEEVLTEEIMTRQQYEPRGTTITETRSARSLSEIIEPPATMAPETVDSSSHRFEDQTSSFTETETYEENSMSRVTREQLLQAHIQPPPVPEFDVTIRSYLPPTDTGDGSSEADTIDRLSVVSERPRVLFEGAEEDVPPPPNWDVLIRVLEPPTIGEPDDVHSIISEDDRDKWRAILSADTNLRSLLTEARTSEEFEIIRQDERYEKLFAPPTWDVIIRILAAPPDMLYDSADSASVSDSASYTSERPATRFRRRSELEGRGRRSSLPPLYEHDGVRLTHAGLPEGSIATTDDEAMFHKYERESEYSEEGSSIPFADQRRKLFRLHRPSLVRSTSEVLQIPDTIERDSLDEDEENFIQTQSSGMALYERFSPPPSPPDASHVSRAHRHLERSTTEITVRESQKNQYVMSRSGSELDNEQTWRS